MAKIKQFMFKEGVIVNQAPLLIEYPLKFHNILESKQEQKVNEENNFPCAKYFSPFIKLNDFINSANLDYESVFIWHTFDENMQLIENPSMKLNTKLLVEITSSF